MQSLPNPLCTVRHCAQPLSRHAARLVCPNNHSFDVARSGYFNLLQPQDRRSKNPGDSLPAVKARRRLHDLRITEPLLPAISGILAPTESDSLLDIGTGEGFYLAALARQSNAAAAGIDISIPAIDLAARRYPHCDWLVANADRFIPYPAQSFSILLSITARMNPAEFHRVLKADGKLLIALPAPDDLIELRGTGRDRVSRTVESFAGHFELARRERVTTTAHLNAQALEDVLLAIYRPLHGEPLEASSLTLSLDLLLFTPRVLVVGHHEH